MKNSLEWFSSRFEEIEERMSTTEASSIEIIQSEEKKESCDSRRNQMTIAVFEGTKGHEPKNNADGFQRLKRQGNRLSFRACIKKYSYVNILMLA